LPKAGGGGRRSQTRGGTATVTVADVTQSDGILHVVDKMLLPK
jgi:uncharacterized surface protein with fasciclin (FAS1) repeats